MAADEYERRYMGGDEAVHREKRVSRRVFAFMTIIAVIPLLLALVSLAAFVFSGDRQGLGGAVLMGAFALMFGVLAVALPVARTIVTKSDLRFMVGLRMMRVPLASITELSLGTIDPGTMRFTVAKERAHVASIFEPRGAYVRVIWHDATGKPQTAWIGSDAPEELRAAIERARSMGGGSHVRVESMHGEPDEAQQAEASAKAESQAVTSAPR